MILLSICVCVCLDKVKKSVKRIAEGGGSGCGVSSPDMRVRLRVGDTLTASGCHSLALPY